MSDRFYSEEQIAAMVHAVKRGLASHEGMCRYYHIPYEKWFCWWRNFSQWDLFPVAEIRRLQEENARLKRIASSTPFQSLN